MPTRPLQSLLEPREIPYVVAEIGKNFITTEAELSVDDLLDMACSLIDAAADAGVDAVKFQTHDATDEQATVSVVSPHFKGADRFSWIQRNVRATPDRFWKVVHAKAAARGVAFFTTAMSRGAARRLATYDLPFWKVGSGDVEDFVLLDYLANTGKPLVLSTGMVGYAELDRVVAYLKARGVQVAILYCVSLYPCPPESANLAHLATLKARYPDVRIGFSDHTIGCECAWAAAALGATILEKHFSLRRDQWGSDHKVSMTPAEMSELIRGLHHGVPATIDTTPFLGPSGGELPGLNNEFRAYFKKTLVVAADLVSGTRLEPDMLYAMRPRMYLDGLPSDAFPTVLGRRLVADVKAGTPLRHDHLA